MERERRQESRRAIRNRMQPEEEKARVLEEDVPGASHPQFPLCLTGLNGGQGRTWDRPARGVPGKLDGVGE